MADERHLPSREQPASPGLPDVRPAKPAEDARANDPVDELGMRHALLEGLKAAGILTVGQLAIELQDESALQAKVRGCGPKSITLLKGAIQKYSQGGAIGAPASAGLGRSNKNYAQADPKKALGWAVFVLLSCMGGVLILALGGLFLTGMQFNETQLHGFNFMAGVIMAVITYKALGYSNATIEGSGYGFKLRVGGPLAGALCVFLILTKATPTFAPRSVFVRLMRQNQMLKVDFDLIVRASGINQFPTRGIGGEAILLLGPHIKEAELDISCAGYKQQGAILQTIPADGIIRIQMKADADVTPSLPSNFPAEASIPDLPTKEQAELPGRLNPEDVTFRYKNCTSKTLKLQVMSVSKYYKQLAGKGFRSSHWATWPLPADCLFHTFDKFQGSGSGWFCFFITWQKDTESDPGEIYLGKWNLFEKRITTLEVVEDNDKDKPFRAIFGP